MTTDKHLSVFVRRWHPEKLLIDPLDEVVLVEDFTVQNLKRQVSCQKKKNIKKGIKIIHVL